MSCRHPPDGPFRRFVLAVVPLPSALRSSLLARSPVRHVLALAACFLAAGGASALAQEADADAAVRTESPADADALREERREEAAGEAAGEARDEDEREAAASTLLAMATAESPSLAEAFRKLEEAEARRDEKEVEEVKAVLEAEIEAGRNLAIAHEGMGRAFLLEHEHAITIFESVQKLFNWDHVSQARKHFRLATEAQPDFVRAWYHWGVAARKAKDDDALREAAEALRRTVDLDPRYRDAYRLLAVTFRELGDVEGSEEVLAEWRVAEGGRAALADLEDAYIHMGLERAGADGAALYWQALEGAGTPEELDAFFEDVKVIVEQDEVEDFRELDVAGRKAWLRAFWDRQADAAVVPRDERLAEHYRRLAHVDETYALTIPQRRHYSAITAYRPREQSGYDDRGVVYLRHGPPDDVARSTAPNVQRNESWLYVRPDGDLIFHFVSDEDTEDFKLVTSLTDALVRGGATLGSGRNTAENLGELFSSRARLDPVYNRLAFQFDPMLLREEEEAVARDVKVGTTTATYVPESPDSLPFFAFPAAFRGPSGEPEVVVYFGVPTGELEMPSGAGGARFAYSAHLVVSDEEGREVAARTSDSVAVQLERAPPREGGVLLPDVLGTPVPAGEYRTRLRVRDLLSRATGTWSGELEVPGPGGFSASSLVLASRIEPSSGSGKFVRSGLKIVPLPSLRFRPGQPIFVYYEIYGLQPGETGRARYRTEYTVRTRERKRNIAVKVLGAVGNIVGSRQERAEEVSLEVDGEAPAAERVREYISLDLQQSEPGPYELRVRIEDLESGREIERSAPFVLTN